MKLIIQKNAKIKKRKTMWFNPPYCKSVKTNIGKKFLKIKSKYFGENSKLKIYLNKSSIKLSYSSVKNNETVIKNHNKKLINNNQVNKDKPCNCRKKHAPWMEEYVGQKM